MILFLFHLLALLIYSYFSLSTIYLLSLAIAGRLLLSPAIAGSRKKRSVCILIPAYKEDTVLLQSLQKVCSHSYEQGSFRVVVIADQLKASTIESMKALPILLLVKDAGQSSKARSLHFALSKIDLSMDDIVLMLDADNIMADGCLNQINDAFGAGFQAVQVHRAAKNTNTPVAILDAISEEINLNIFRRGAFHLGLSAAPMGSGMAFSKAVFTAIFSDEETIASLAEDRQVESYLSSNNLTMAFLDHATVYDEKVSSTQVFKNQRIRWMEAQLTQFSYYFRYLTSSGTKSKQFYHTFIQTMLLPRVLYLVLTIIFLLLLLCDRYVYPGLLYPSPLFWLIMIGLYWLVLLISIPARFYNFSTVKAIFSLPVLMLTMVASLLKLRKGREEFLHTTKSFVSDD